MEPRVKNLYTCAGAGDWKDVYSSSKPPVGFPDGSDSEESRKKAGKPTLPAGSGTIHLCCGGNERVEAALPPAALWGHFVFARRRATCMGVGC